MHVNSLSKPIKDVLNTTIRKRDDIYGYTEGFQISQISFTQRNNLKSKQPKQEIVKLPYLSGARSRFAVDKRISDLSVVSYGLAEGRENESSRDGQQNITNSQDFEYNGAKTATAA